MIFCHGLANNNRSLKIGKLNGGLSLYDPYEIKEMKKVWHVSVTRNRI
jgi:hypothetical protein